MSIELILSITGGLAAGFKWVYEYSRKNTWDQNKFLLEQIEKLESLESTKCAQRCLDWNSATISYQGEKIRITDENLIESLQTHDKKHRFTSDEVMIRKIFDEYFDSLTKLIILTKSQLISKKNLVLFLDYWIKILSGESKNKKSEVIDQIHQYLVYYGYEHLYNFIKEKK